MRGSAEQKNQKLCPVAQTLPAHIHNIFASISKIHHQYNNITILCTNINPKLKSNMFI